MVTGRESSVDDGPEYHAFIAKVQAFYAQRGTSFDPQPKVGNKRVDLLRLYRRVTGLGGYDVVSDTKSQKLAWRTIGQEFNLGTTNLPALAFNLKSVYYRNLAAFEIVDLHKRVPPPPEILEQVSAKGGNLLGRTLDNYTRPTRDKGDGADGDGEDDDQDRTPRGSRMDIDEPSSLRGGRNLRQAPPQRVLFQNDLSSSRQTRNHNMATSPTPGSVYPYGATNGVNSYTSNLPQTLANYEPKQQIPLTLRPVNTPSNNPEAYKASEIARRDRILEKYVQHTQQPKGMMFPGTGFTGPSIYIRTLLALQSGVIEEQEYALHHLVKISHERGDKYRFDGFSGLAEALIDKVLDINLLLTGHQLDISYEYMSIEEPDRINALHGTADILEKAARIRAARIPDRIETTTFSRRLCLVNEAALVLRNMVMLEENADYISRYPVIRDIVILLIHLPDHSSISELRHYGFDIAEQLSKFFPANSGDPLLQSLIDFADDTDRAVVLASLRAISRMGTHLPTLTPLHSIPIETILRICDWLLVEDYELRTACLDLLYRYTAVVENVEELLSNFDLEVLIQRIARLLLHGAKTTGNKPEEYSKSKPQPPAVPAEETPIPKIPSELVEQLLVFDEPERSSQWLKACFEEDTTGEITQIALWQAYQIPFAPHAATRPLLPAKDFITNVSTTFVHASAQVMNGPTPRFVIKGIKPRRVPVDPQGRAFSRCLWRLDTGDCGEFALDGKSMWEHIVSTHLGVSKNDEGQYVPDITDTTTYSCKWASCNRFADSEAASAFTVGMHVKTHMPDISAAAVQRAKHNVLAGEQQAPGVPATKAWTMHDTLTDERSDAIGMPLTSALVLRNLARVLPKTSVAVVEEAQAEGMDVETDEEAKNAENVLWTYFGGVKDQLYYVMAHNQPLREYLAPLAQSIVAQT